MTDMKIENRKVNRSASENDKQHKKSFAIETEAFNSPDHTLARLNSSRQELTTEDAFERRGIMAAMRLRMNGHLRR